MTLDQVIETLDTTIEGKQKLLAALDNAGPMEGPVRNHVAKITAEFLRLNLTELNNIRDHLLLVNETITKEREKAALDNWRSNPDRMGGCYSFEEMAASRGWI